MIDLAVGLLSNRVLVLALTVLVVLVVWRVDLYLRDRR